MVPLGPMPAPEPPPSGGRPAGSWLLEWVEQVVACPYSWGWADAPAQVEIVKRALLLAAEAREAAAGATLGPFDPASGRMLHTEAVEELVDLVNYAVRFHSRQHVPRGAEDLPRAREDVLAAAAMLLLRIGRLQQVTRRPSSKWPAPLSPEFR